MVKKRFGFTLIEVALFLAITGALFVGIVIGTQNSIFQQRYNDAVQNFAEFLRSAYSETMNVQSEGTGRSEKAIYGKLVSFGETENLAGENISNTDSVFSYNVVGKVGEINSNNVLDALKELGANVAVKDEAGNYQATGMVENYRPKWASAIQNTNNENSFEGALLIVRHPSSGTVYTFVMRGAMNINEGLRLANYNGTEYNPLKTAIEQKKFEIQQVDFCVNPNGIGEKGVRRDVRIVKAARNGSGVEIIGEGEGDLCERL